MLDLFYSTKAFHENVNQKRHHFLLAIDTDVCVGFASYEHNYTQKPITRIHKIYILPETQGKGIGKLLLDKIESFAKENHCNTLSLNVNRYNKALTFYQKSGFKTVLEEDILLDHGYKMEDYRMEKEL